MTSGLSGEVQPAEAMCDLVENEYILSLIHIYLKNLSVLRLRYNSVCLPKVVDIISV